MSSLNIKITLYLTIAVICVFFLRVWAVVWLIAAWQSGFSSKFENSLFEVNRTKVDMIDMEQNLEHHPGHKEKPAVSTN